MLGGRRKAREICLRVLYETDITGDDILVTLEMVLGRYRLNEDGRDYAVYLAGCCSQRIEEIDSRLRASLLRWDLKRVSVMARAILRLATAELLCAPDVPARVILDQAVELAKRYCEEDAEGFVNGVLDPVAESLRGAELRGGGPE